MVLYSHFGLVGMLGSAINSSLSYIAESENSLVSSLTVRGGGGCYKEKHPMDWGRPT